MYPYFEPTNIVMATCWARRSPASASARAATVLRSANVLAFDFCFVPPQFTFSVATSSTRDVHRHADVTLVIANLMASVRQQTRSRARAQRAPRCCTR
jgi:two-component system sensor histidine kinase KdpD